MRIVVMAKAPDPGGVKTRLAAALGVEQATALAAAFLDDTVALAGRFGPVVLATTRVDVRPDVEIWLQGEGNLGDRLERVARRASPVVLLGGDSPGMPDVLLRSAIDAVESGKAALVPAEDGGFTLLGLPHCPVGLFAGIAWSTPAAGEEMFQALQREKLVTVIPGTWWDVDLPSDLDRLWAEVPPERIPATHRLRPQEFCEGLPTR